MANSQQVLTNALTWVLTVISTILIALRLWSRIRIKPNFGWDDVAIIISQLVNVTFSILISMAVASGTGKPIATIDPVDLPYAIKINTIANAVSIITFTLPKIAIALLLVRILSLDKITTGFFIGLAVFLNIYGCVQIASFLIYAVNKPTITVNTALGEGALSAFADFFYGAYPVWVIVRLQMAARRKIAISIMFALGMISCVVACYKCTKLNVLKSRHLDLTYSSAPLMYWTSIEANVVTIAACVPTLGPIFALVWKSTDGYLSNSNYQYRGHQSYHQFPHGEGYLSNKRAANVQSKSIDNIELVGPGSPGVERFGPGSQHRKSNKMGNAIGIHAHDLPDSDEESLGSGGRNSGGAPVEPQLHVATGNAPDGITKRVEFSVSEEYNNNNTTQQNTVGGPSHRHANSTHAPNFSTPAGRRTGNAAEDDGTQQRLYQSYGMARPSEVV